MAQTNPVFFESIGGAKIPSRLDLPEDARFQVVRRTRVASAAYLLLSAP